MKKSFAVLLLLCLGSLTAYSQKWRIGQPPPHAQPGVNYPIPMHLSAIRLRNEYEGGGQNETLAYTDIVVNGKKFELCGVLDPYPGFHITPPLPGDYQARLLKEPKKAIPDSSSELLLGQEYELILRDGALWRATITGLSE